ncbi:hypothetical protein CVIRNUC_007632 [Coccomyxa viridis]|uniref:Exostosin GT47 domain-containing protein n=1 Tax=Coccomyxa viridis TaxID=1274662 RepID=A0AAV1IAN6_9CHLO|nr:hypothetical protein CVIRNUC_007632 [Coccomyxa viridis]
MLRAQYLLLLTAAACLRHGTWAANEISTCEGKSIYVMDLGMFAAQHDLPQCSQADVKLDPGNGIPYLLDSPKFKAEEGLPYALAQHSGPWHLREAIAGSKYVTADMEQADIIYVYDHCYYMLWLAQVHTKGRKMPEEASPAGDWLMALYGSMLSSSRWQQNQGADFVFYDPHPGFTDGSVEAAYYKMLCDDFQHAMHIVVERGQRNICKAYWEISKKLMIVPYVPGSTDNREPLLGFQQPILPLEERQNLLFFRATCLPFMYLYPNNTRISTGKVMRHDVALALGKSGPNVDAMCTDKEFGGRFLSFQKVMDRMKSTLFCLVLPGDSASARRTSEIFMAGCIPVFLGPPYGSMPLAEEGGIDYKASSLFFNVTEYRGWIDDDMVWEIPRDERPFHVCNPWTWIPDIPVRDVAVQLQTVDELMDHLRTIPRSVLDQKLQAVMSQRQKFSFQPYITAPPSAINIILSRMCSTKKPEPIPGQDMGTAGAAAV